LCWVVGWIWWILIIDLDRAIASAQVDDVTNLQSIARMHWPHVLLKIIGFPPEQDSLFGK
jgi:hypothetical protein